MATREEVRTALEACLQRMAADGPAPDVLTFAGNGEPTIHPDFPEIIDDTLHLRDRYFPRARVSVLSNATQILRPAVHEALMRVDNNIQKLDTVDGSFISTVDRPCSPSYDVKGIIEGLKAFQGHVIIQTMFLSGTDEHGKDVTNTDDRYVQPWLEALTAIAPRQVMIYTIDRETPVASLKKAQPEQLDAIAARVRSLGIPCSVAY